MMTERLLPVLWAGLVALCAPALAQGPGTVASTTQDAIGQTGPETRDEATVEEVREEATLEVPFNILENERLTGDWWGARKWLEDKGIEFSLSLTNAYQQNFRGGLSTDNGHDLIGSADYELTLDFEKMGLWEGGILYALAESGWNDDIGLDKVGSLFAVNGDAYLGDYAIQLSELWYQQSFLDNKVRVKVGKMDITLDFDAAAYASDETSQFLNFAFVNMPNIPWPDYAQGILAAVQPVDWLYLQGAIVDDQASGRKTGFDTFYHDECYTFSMFETGFLPVWETRWGKLPGGYRFMLWYDPQPKPRFLDAPYVRRSTDDTGFGFTMDQLLVKEHPADDADSQGLGMFFRYGYAHDEVNLIEHFWSIGAQYQGLVPTRDDDVLAFGFAQSIIGGRANALGLGDRESIYEIYYNIAVFPWLAVTPDLQYIQQPGGLDSVPDSFIAGLRLTMSF